MAGCLRSLKTLQFVNWIFSSVLADPAEPVTCYHRPAGSLKFLKELINQNKPGCSCNHFNFVMTCEEIATKKASIG
jgi:hypothetical protein